jgi:hypothetical protein
VEHLTHLDATREATPAAALGSSSSSGDWHAPSASALRPLEGPSSSQRRFSAVLGTIGYATARDLSFQLFGGERA